MKTPNWLQTLSTKRYNKRQQEILDEIARLRASRVPVHAKNEAVDLESVAYKSNDAE